MEAPVLQRALYETEGFNPQHSLFSWPLYDREATVAIVRLALLSRTAKPQIERMSQLIEKVMNWQGILTDALLLDFSEAMFARVDPGLRFDIAYWGVQAMCADWNMDSLPLVNWTLAQRKNKQEQIPSYLRIALAELLLHRGENDAALATIKGLDEGAVDALKAYVLA